RQMPVRRRLPPRGLRRGQAEDAALADEPVAGEPILQIDVTRDLVARRRLPGYPPGVAQVPAVVHAEAGSVRREHEVARARVVERIGRILVEPPVAAREQEPEPVPDQRATHRSADVPDALRLVDGAQALVAQRLRAVVALQAVVRAVQEERPLEGIAAFFRNHVDADAAGAGLRRNRTRFVADLLDARIVPG